MPAYFNTGALREASWHGGELFLIQGNPGIWETMVKVGMDYETLVGTATSTVTWNGQEYHLPVDDRVFLWRPPTTWDPEWKRLRTMSDRYEPVQNKWLADLLDGLRETWPLEGVMTLADGAITIIQLGMREGDADHFFIGDKENGKHKAYLMVSNDHRAGSLVYNIGFVRVVCWNTYNMALNDKNKRLSRIPHNGSDIHDQLRFHRDLSELALDAIKEERKELEALFDVRPDEAQIDAFFARVFPYGEKSTTLQKVETLVPEGKEAHTESIAKMVAKANKDRKTYQAAKEQADRRRAAAKHALKVYNDTEANEGRGSAYAVFQSATEVINWPKRVNDKGEPDSAGKLTWRGPEEANIADAFFGLSQTKQPMLVEARAAVRDLK